MPIHKDGISRPKNEKPYSILYRVEKTVTEYWETTVWAEDAEDAEALSENFWNDGHVCEEEPYAEKTGTFISHPKLRELFIGTRGE